MALGTPLSLVTSCPTCPAPYPSPPPVALFLQKCCRSLPSPLQSLPPLAPLPALATAPLRPPPPPTVLPTPDSLPPLLPTPLHPVLPTIASTMDQYRDFFSQAGSSSAATRNFHASPDASDEDDFGPFTPSAASTLFAPGMRMEHLDLNS
uniref:Uncharacterized protein n=1 Tax=Setaria viridis TaxID=4556 RepID=A0A4U6VLP9_SETVI|nr:hypothetical protein SEVIR_3G106400v2 [Setaria viridis]